MEQVRCPVLVGRTGELEVLNRALGEARKGAGSTVVVAGEAGVGKTRICAELRTAAISSGMVAMWGGCSVADLTLPYLPIVEAVTNHLAQTDVASLDRRLGPVRRDLGALFPQFSAGRLGDHGLQARLRMFEAIVQLLIAAAERSGLLLVIEDVHWADEATRGLLDYLARRVRSLPILILITHRTDELHRRHPLLPLLQGWRRSALATTVQLQPLSRDGVASMLRETLSARPVPDETCDLLYERSEGNPFVLEELVKAVVDRGDLFPTSDGWTRRELSEIRLPESVRDSILLRVERLEPPAVNVLRAAAVLGISFDHRLLAEMCGVDGEVVRSALAHGVHEQLLDEDPVASKQLRFRHALTREAVYDDLIAPERERLHEQAAETLARAGAPAVAIAHHLLAAGFADRAVPYCLEAAEAAHRSHAYADAAVLYEKALPYLHGRADAARAMESLGAELLLTGEPGRAEQYLTKAVAELAAAGCEAAVPNARLLLGRALWELARPDLAMAEYEAALAALEPAGPSPALAAAYFRLAQINALEFDPATSLEMSGRAIQLATDLGDVSSRIWARLYQGTAEGRRGNLERAREIADEARREADAHGETWIANNALWHSIAWAAVGLWIKEAETRLADLLSVPSSSFPAYMIAEAHARVLMAKGDFLHAATQYREAITAMRSSGALVYYVRSATELAICMAILGKVAEARGLLGSLVTGSKQGEAFRMIALLAVALEADDEEGLAWVRANLDRVLVFASAWGRTHDRMLAALIRLGRVGDAASYLRRMKQFAMPLALHHLGEARMLLAQDRPEAARAMAMTASESFRVLGAAYEQCICLRLAGGDVELRRALDLATAHGYVLEARRIRQALGAGSAEDREAVKADLEGLARLPRSARERLVAAMRSLSTSSDGRDAEAGEVLLDYYVRRAGSHETVAERLHLSRATFYRRLHRGLTRVSEVLGDADPEILRPPEA